jgi:hypothetical protein
MTALIAALLAIGGPVCKTAASELETEREAFDLHLRGAGLDVQDAQALAEGLQDLSASGRVLLRSFSASYNPDLGDAGAIVLAQALPVTVTEVGLVGCAIGDAGAAALLDWAQRAPDLRMICVEGNRLSVQMKATFTALGRQRALMVVV